MSKELVAIIFSKDRALQLDLCLSSLKHRCSDLDQADIKVLYKTTSTQHQATYNTLFSEHSTVIPIQENSFKNDLLSAVEGYKFILFVTDDTIFIEQFTLQEIMDSLNKCENCIGFSLRLGFNIQWCYPVAQPNTFPYWYKNVQLGIVSYRWLDEDAILDFNYPLEVSSSCYKSETVMPLLSQTEYNSPNMLETYMFYYAMNLGFYQTRENLLCYKQQKAFANPLNSVQVAVVEGRNSKLEKYSIESMLEKYESGFRVDPIVFNGVEISGCHQEVDLW